MSINLFFLIPSLRTPETNIQTEVAINTGTLKNQLFTGHWGCWKLTNFLFPIPLKDREEMIFQDTCPVFKNVCKKLKDS